MSLRNEDDSSQDQPTERNHGSQKKVRISYTRDYLLSLSDLDVCKKLPSDVDQSILSEFEESSHFIQDRQRTSSSLSLQSFRRNEYGSSPPTRGDSTFNSRGLHGKWDSRPSGWNDRDSDSQSDKDSEFGRRHNHQSWRSFQNSEHDGLLGSGSFPRPSGHAAPKVQLSRTTEPYHPPRPYKAVPHLRIGSHDSYNDETFGSVECSSQDRAEEERKRRASFELMRKEQHKAFQEKNKFNQKENSDLDITKVLGDTKDEKKILNKESELDEAPTNKDSNNDSSRTSLPSTHASRPLVPPGFRKSINNSLEVGSVELGTNITRPKDKLGSDKTFDDHVEKQTTKQIDFSENIMKSSPPLEIFNETIRLNSPLYKSSILSETLEDGDSVEGDADDKNSGREIIGESDQDGSTSILDKLFSSALSLNSGGSSGFIEHQDIKEDDAWSPNTVQSSKFARWFVEEEKKPADELSSGRPNDLLSLIVGGEKGSQMSNKRGTESFLANFPIKTSEMAKENVKSNITSSSVLTCEDLEQSMLLEISEHNSSTPHPVQGLNGVDTKTEPPKGHIDNRASKHLLSLLQKGTDSKGIVPSSKLNMISERPLSFVEEVNAENVDDRKNLKLETLFGSAFMEELQSLEAPVSLQRGLSGSTNRTQMELENEQQLPGFDNVRAKVHLSKLQEKPGLSNSSFNGSVEIPLPDEDSLITVGNNNSMFIPKVEFTSVPNAPVSITEKLAALNSLLKNERSIGSGQENQLIFQPSYDKFEPEIPYQNFRGNPLFHSLDSHPPHHQVPSNNARPPFQLPSTGAIGFDHHHHHHHHHHHLLQHMQAQGNYPPPHMLRAAALHPQNPNKHAPGFIQELNPMQAFAFGHQQPNNFDGLRLPVSVPDNGGGSNHPEALQRLIGMELRSNPNKQIHHPFAVAGHSQDMTFGHELDTGFRHR